MRASVCLHYIGCGRCCRGVEFVVVAAQNECRKPYGCGLVGISFQCAVVCVHHNADTIYGNGSRQRENEGFCLFECG